MFRYFALYLKSLNSNFLISRFQEYDESMKVKRWNGW